MVLWYAGMLLQNIYYAPFSDSVKTRFERRFREFIPPLQSELIGTPERNDAQTSRTRSGEGSRTRESALLVYGHTLRVPGQVAGRRTARFTFEGLCGQAYGPADFIELARLYSVIFLSDIPKMDLSHKNEVHMRSDCSVFTT